mmetsp:Transcript_46808/g.110149  ORF Transcript_46808/g.110149 Transcript_46808/m.110149 type:complete len:344 (+) Transcript_46808:2509-3540(+)
MVGLQLGPHQLLALALAHLDGLLDAQEALGRVLHDDAGGLQQEDEARGRAIEHRHLIGIDVDEEVVQPQAGAGRQQMFDGLNLGPAGVAPRADGRGHARVADRQHADRDVHRRAQVDTAEHDAGVRRRRPQGQLDLLPAVDADTHRAGERLQGALLDHGRDCPGSGLGLALNGQSQRQPRAHARCRVDAQLAAQPLGALELALQAAPVPDVLQIEAGAIVLDADLDMAAVMPRHHAYTARLCVLEHIVQGFLHQAQHMQRIRRLQPGQRRQVLHIPFELQPARLQPLAQAVAHRGEQRHEVVTDGFERVDHEAQVIHAFAQHLHALLVRHAALLHGHQRRQQG